MIEFTKKSSITMYTDHSTTISIARQTSLSSFNIDKLNLRLIQASQYLFIFKLNIRYKSGNKNLISDALFRLLRERSKNASNMKVKEILEILHTAVEDFAICDDHYTYVFAAFLVEMSENFRQQLLETMIIDKR